MKKAFQGHYQLDPAELDEVWSEGIPVLDTNALLNLYRYTEETNGEFIAAISAMADQLWLPHQVGLEYHARRVDVISGQAKAYGDLRAGIDRGKKGILEILGKYRRHPVLDADTFGEAVEDAVKPLIQLVQDAENEHSSLAVAKVREDPVLGKVTALYEGKVGPAFEPDILVKMHETGRERYDKKVPPGFKDNAKDEGARYGDFLIWMQILERAKSESKHVIFVTDDAKSDWWQEHEGEVLGPRTELRQEFFEQVGKLVQFYRSEQFLKFSGEKRGATVSAETLQEVDEVSSRDANAVAAIAVDLINDKHRALLRSIESGIGSYVRATQRLLSTAHLLGVQVDGRSSPELDVLEVLARDIGSFTRHFRDSGLPPDTPFPFEYEIGYWLRLRDIGDVLEFGSLEGAVPYQSSDVTETLGRDLRSHRFARTRLASVMREYLGLARQSDDLALNL